MVVYIIKETIFLFLTGLGLLGNMAVFANYICIFFVGTEKRSVYLILIHLAFTNIILLFSKGTPNTIAVLGLGNLLGDGGCKTVVYLERVARGLSICTSSLLVVVQAVIMSPRASVWGRARRRSAGHILPLLLFFWILNCFISMNLLCYIRSTNSMNTSLTRSHRYCYFVPESWIIRWVFFTFLFLRDALFQGLMACASDYLVLLLHAHHKHVLYLQNTQLLCTTAPEIRAAQSVLLLMLCFLSFYWTDCIISLYLSFSLEQDSITANVREFAAVGYAVLSPFVLIHRDGIRLNVGICNKIG
ncbi:vomeronasal 1 receptor oryCunV1R1523 [Oryctolagus cuniculus]|uniref:Vomeronasal type-1 receptor n=1 Tax=Oryctolagus cuniculus TaxID=9986 RepID=G1U3C7_RABIT|nr:vomeronasal 1 receptor oryCunV1R1523 [Oryctolagus cuniculus]